LTNESGLEQRRNWFRFFPEGTIEFVVATRVLAVLLLLLLGVVKGTQRPPVLMALAGILWIDYVLTMYWVAQLATDLSGLLADAVVDDRTLARRRMRAGFFLALPATCFLLMVSPWPRFLLAPGPAQQSLARTAAIGFGLAFLVALLLAYRQLRKMPLGLSGWLLIALIPLLHWLALHRLLSVFHRQLCEKDRQLGQPEDEGGPGLAAAMADGLWFLSVLPWLIMIAVGLSRGGWPMNTPYRFMPVCGSVLFALFSIVDMAAMENVQRHFVRLLRAAPRAPDKSA
jgi:hypothetical protein